MEICEDNNIHIGLGLVAQVFGNSYKSPSEKVPNKSFNYKLS